MSAIEVFSGNSCRKSMHPFGSNLFVSRIWKKRWLVIIRRMCGISCGSSILGFGFFLGRFRLVFFLLFLSLPVIVL